MTDLDELHAWTTRVESDVADLALAVQQLREELSEAVAGDTVRKAQPSRDEVDAWVRDYFRVTFARNTTTTWRWCAQWPEHPEARERLTALHAGWKEAQQTGRMLAWLRDADAQLAALSDAGGTFAACSDRGHYPPPQLPQAPQERTPE